MKINQDYTLSEIKKIPELEEIKDILLINYPVLRDDMTLADIGESAPRYDTGSLVLGVNRLLEIRAEGRNLNLPLYTPEEIAQEPSRSNAALTFFPGKEGMPYVVLCSGGAYVLLTNLSEAFPTAALMNQQGYNVFVVTYRVNLPELLPKPQEDVAAAIRYIESHADALKVRKGDYAIGGFSAGGHVAASWGTKEFGYRRFRLPAPGALLLCYPGIVMSVLCADTGYDLLQQMKETLFGKGTDADWKQYDINLLVDPEYPPTYLWHCKDDVEVPYESSAMFSDVLEKNGVRHLMDSFEHGGHGRGAAVNSEAECWIDHALRFWKDI